MSQYSSIEWTEATWNVVRGCKKVSPGCKHCYAERFSNRFLGIAGHPFEFGFSPRLVPEKLTEPLRLVRPKTIFVNSMSDLFLEDIPTGYLQLVCEVMKTAQWHTFQVLTKRQDRMRALLSGELSFASELENVWWGVSVEDRRYGLPRIEQLRHTPAKVRFLSIEPLLEDLGALNLQGDVAPFSTGHLDGGSHVENHQSSAITRGAQTSLHHQAKARFIGAS